MTRDVYAACSSARAGAQGVLHQYNSAARFVSAQNMPGITFLRNCVVEIYGMDLAVSYQQIFLSIRDHAAELRSALTSRKKVCACVVHG
jgi:nucleolar complex protein 2